MVSMSIVQSRPETTRVGGVTGAGFMPGQSGNPGGRPKGLSRRVRELVGDDGQAIAQYMFTVLRDETQRTPDRMEAAKWLADRAFGRAVQALDIDVYPSSVDISHLSTVNLRALRAIFEKYSPDVAELAESGELRLGAGPVEATGSRQR
jgi:hypothetical protein